MLTQSLQILIDFFKSPLIYSWQTLLKLSIVSYAIAIIARLMSNSDTYLVSNFISICGSLFLVIAFSWVTIEYQIYFSDIKPETPLLQKLTLILWQFLINFRPWFVSGLICILLIIHCHVTILPLGLIIWTPLAGIISIISEFITPDLHWKLPTLQQYYRIIILLGIQVLISCWIQVYLIINTELHQYPTILADDFSKNHFVLKYPYSEPIEPLGVFLIDTLASQYRQELNKRPWSEIVVLTKKIWQNPPLNPELQQQILDATQQDDKQTRKINKEGTLWQLGIKVEVINLGYNLIINALWQGEKANPKDPYSIEKICEIRPIFPDPNDSQTAISQIECQSTKIQGWD